MKIKDLPDNRIGRVLIEEEALFSADPMVGKFFDKATVIAASYDDTYRHIDYIIHHPAFREMDSTIPLYTVKYGDDVITISDGEGYEVDIT